MKPIEQIRALEILDSRGRPTVRATCRLEGGVAASASVPSGASTGRGEAIELRDADPQRYRGLGCRKAVANVNGPIHDALAGVGFDTQAELDHALIDLDGTPDKSGLGANAILAVSIAFARAAAAEEGMTLDAYFARLAGLRVTTLPRLTINLFSGGKHAGAQVPVQDLLIIPRASTIEESLAMMFAIYQQAAEFTSRKYGVRALRADEGGLAPPFASVESMFEDAIQSIEGAGFIPREDAALAVDVASSHFYHHERYHLGGRCLTSPEMIHQLVDWVEQYPIFSLEDGLAEDDWSAWPDLCSAIASRCLVLGDDFLCTNSERVRRAIETKAANALLLKVNQVGTLTEAAEAAHLARAAGWRITVSARSGETEDDWLADLAVGWGGDQIKVGSITQSERLAKYNRLLALEKDRPMPLVDWP